MSDSNKAVNAPTAETQGVEVQKSASSLTTESLAKLFLEQESAEVKEAPAEEKPEEQENTESTEETEEPAKEEEAGEEESPETSEDEEPEAEPAAEDSEDPDGEQDDLSQFSLKAKEKVQKRINKLTKRAKTAEEENLALKARLEQLEQRVEQVSKADKKPVNQSIVDRVLNADEATLTEIEREVSDLRKWARRNVHEDEVVIGEQTVPKEKVIQFLEDAEEALEKHIPARRSYLSQRKEMDAAAEQEFPGWKDKSSEQGVWLHSVWSNPNTQRVLGQLPNAKYLLGLLYEGHKAHEAKKKAITEPKKEVKPVAKPAPKVPGMDVNSSVKPKSVDPMAKAKARIAGKSSISTEDLAGFFLAEEKAKH